MKTKRFSALVCVALTLSLMGVGVFAFQPPDQSPLVQYGAHQIGDFNSTATCTVVRDTCEVCGADITGYNYVFNVSRDLLNQFYTGCFAIIDTTGLNRNFNGIYNLLDDTHMTSNHTDSTAYVNYSDINNNIGIFVTREITATDGVRFTALYVPDALTVESGIGDFVTDYVTSVTAHTAYSYGVISPSPVQGYLDDMHADALRLAYNDGQINGSQNADMINGANNIFADIRIALTPLLEFEILGVSVISFVSLLVTFTIIMIIIKVVRG